MENGPDMKMYFLLKMEIFHPAMFVYQRMNSLTNYSHQTTPARNTRSFTKELDKPPACPFF